MNFIRYAAWPDDDSTQRAYVLVVVGGGDTARAMVELAERTGPIRDRDVRVRRFGSRRPTDDDDMSELDVALQGADVVFDPVQNDRVWMASVAIADCTDPVQLDGSMGAGSILASLRATVTSSRRSVLSTSHCFAASRPWPSW
mgnify:CR=1 FL=1